MNTKKRRLGCKKEAFSPFLFEKVTNSKKNIRVTQKARYVYLSQQKSEDCLTHLSYKLEEISAINQIYTSKRDLLENPRLNM